jgi:hypothetical protein
MNAKSAVIYIFLPYNHINLLKPGGNFTYRQV